MDACVDGVRDEPSPPSQLMISASRGQWTVSLSGVSRYRGDSIYHKIHPQLWFFQAIWAFLSEWCCFENSIFDLSNPNHTLHLCFMTVSCTLTRKSNFLSTGHSFRTIVRCNNIVFPTDHSSQKTLAQGKPLLNMTLVRSPVPGALRRQYTAIHKHECFRAHEASILEGQTKSPDAWLAPT